MAVWGTAWQAPVLHFPIHQPHQPRCPLSGSGFLPPADALPGLQSPRNTLKSAPLALSLIEKLVLAEQLVSCAYCITLGGGGVICLIESRSLLMTRYVASRSLWTCRRPLLVFGWKYHPLLETARHKNVSSASWSRWWWWRALFEDGEDTRGLAL